MQSRTFIEEILHHATSGTSAEPNSTPMPMMMTTHGPWMLMFHANVFITDEQQSSPRGGDKFFSTNWFMPMAKRRLGPGQLTVRAMFSLEPATITRSALSAVVSARRNCLRRAHRRRPASPRFLHGAGGSLRLATRASKRCSRFTLRRSAIRRWVRRRIRIAPRPRKIPSAPWAIIRKTQPTLPTMLRPWASPIKLRALRPADFMVASRMNFAGISTRGKSIHGRRA